MPLYPNGSIPLDRLVPLDSGDGKHLTTPTSAARWYALRAKVLREKGVLLEITAGWNAYRPLREQYAARAWACNAGNCLGAAVPGSSSHGGTWSGPATGWVLRDAMAFDVHNYWRIPWDYFIAACKSVGLLADGIPLSMSGGVSEKHHIIDLDPWGPIPSHLNVEDFDVVTEQDKKDIAAAAAQAVWSFSAGYGSLTMRAIVRSLWGRLMPGREGVKYDGDVYKIFLETRAAAVANEAAVKALAGAQGANSDEIAAIVEAAVKDAMSGLSVTLNIGDDS